MNADPQLRERLDRAAADLRIDPEPRLDDIHRSAPRRERNRRVAALVVAAAVGLAAVGVVWQLRSTGDRTHRPAADVAPTGRIAYMSLTKPLSRKDASDLFVLDAGTGDVVPLVEGEGFSIFARWSPNGSKVAYLSDERGGPPFNDAIEILVADADGTDAVSLLGPGRFLDDPGPIDLSWSPDGSRIAFAGRELGTDRSGVSIVNADGTGYRRMLGGYWEAISWSPDGRRLALTGDPDTEDGSGQIDLYTVRLDGTGLVRLTDDGSTERLPSWSPDGTRIVFADVRVPFKNPDYGQDVYVIDADGSDLRRLSDWEGLDSFAVWSPDGTWIAFASDRDASPEQQEGNRTLRPFSGVSIFAMRPDGSDVVRLLDGGEVAFLPTSWTS
jgi:TolB protein